MDLEMTTSEVNIIHWFTQYWMRKKKKVGLEEFISQAYSRDKDFLLCEAANDTEYYFEVAEKKGIDDLDKPELEEIFKTCDVPIYDLHVLLQDMVNKDMLPTGNYLVRVSW